MSSTSKYAGCMFSCPRVRKHYTSTTGRLIKTSLRVETALDTDATLFENETETTVLVAATTARPNHVARQVA